MERILVIGGTGFIGSAVIRSLAARNDVILRVLARDPARLPSGVDETIVGDFLDEQLLSEALQGQSAVVHAANYLGKDEALQERVNAEGSALVTQVAAENKVERVVSFSNTAVYGREPLRGQRSAELTPAPQSALNSTRLVADQKVLAAGGIVLRTNLTYGLGDKLVVPAMLAFIRRLGALIDQGKAVVSVISVDDLALVAASLASGRSEWTAGTLYHAAYPKPVMVSDILKTCAQSLDVVLPHDSLSAEQAFSRGEELGVGVGQVAMIAQDRWVAASEVWETTGLSPRDFVLSDAEIEWYRRFV